MAAVSLGAGAGGATVVDAWRPAVEVARHFDDDRTAPAGSRATGSTVIAPELGFARSWRTLDCELRGRRRYDVLSQTSSPILHTDRLSARAAYGPGDHSVARAEYRLLSSTDTWESENAVTSTADVTQQRGSAELELRRLEASFRASAWAYGDRGISEGGSRAYAATLLPLHSATGAVTIGGRRWELGTSASPRVTSTAGLVGYRRTHSRALSSEAGVGVASVFLSGDGGSEWRPAAEAVVTAVGQFSGRPAHVRLSYRRDVTSLGGAELARAVGTGEWSARWERALEVEGGVFREPTTIDRVALAAVDTIGHDNAVRIEWRWDKVRPFPGPGPSVARSDFSAGLARAVQPWLLAGVSYRIQRQEAFGQSGAPALYRHRIGISLTARIP